MARLFTRASSDFLNVGTAIAGVYPFTMACWFRSVSDSAEQTLMSIGAVGDDDNIHSLKAAGHVAGDPVRAESRENNTAIALTSTGYSVNVWDLACGVFRAADDRSAYRSGGSRGDDNENRTPAGLDSTGIGFDERLTPSDFMDGDIAWPTFWDTDLNDLEVAAMFLAPIWRIRPQSIVGLFPLWGIHSPEIDLTGLGNEMTVNGAVKSVSGPPTTLWTPKWAANAALAPTITPVVSSNLPLFGQELINPAEGTNRPRYGQLIAP